VLGDAISRIGQIRAGDLSVRFTMAPATQPQANAVGVEMQGSFALDRRLPLPILHVAYTQLAGAQTKSTRIDSNGHSATVLSGGRPIPLNSQQQQALASTLRGPQGLGALPLHISNWVTHPRQGPGPTVGGAPTEQVSGGVNLGQLLNDLGALTGGKIDRATGSGSATNAFQKTLRSSAFVADVGRRDHLLRRLYLRVNLAPHTSSTSSPPPAGALTIVLNIAIDPRPLAR
jgi:hypothetical protein